MRLNNELKMQILSSVMADTTKVDYLEQAQAAVKKEILATAPKVMRDAYKFDPAAFRYETVYRDDVHISYPFLFEGAKAIAKTDTITPLIKKHLMQEIARREARRSVERLLSECTTTDMVIAVAPELEKYLPKDAPKKSLPVALDLKDKLVAAGWPKGGKRGVK